MCQENKFDFLNRTTCIRFNVFNKVFSVAFSSTCNYLPKVMCIQMVFCVKQPNSVFCVMHAIVHNVKLFLSIRAHTTEKTEISTENIYAREGLHADSFISYDLKQQNSQKILLSSVFKLMQYLCTFSSASIMNQWPE